MGIFSGNKQPIFFETLINTIPNPIFYKDLNSRFTGCNLAFEKFFNLTKKELIGKTVYDITSKELGDVFTYHDKILFENPGKQEYESLLTDAHGVTHNLIFNKATFTDEKGQVKGIVGIALDITDIKKAEEIIAKKAKNLEKINKLMINRELKMIELKNKIKKLEQKKSQRCKD